MNIGRRPKDIREVAERNLCSGCGVCAYLQPEAIQMVDTREQGRRPLVLVEVNGRAVSTGSALRACPGAAIEHQDEGPPAHLQDLGSDWGPVLELWEGWASDPEIRWSGSSGGVATALALHCIEKDRVHGVLHVVPRNDRPLLNHSVLSRTRSDLLAGAGSRYAPASPCERLDLIENAPASCVFIGKPCDIAGARNAARQRPALARNLSLTIAVFCAGTPTTNGTIAAVQSVGMDPDTISSVTYRGQGWPGRFTVTDNTGQVRSLSYEQSWGEILQKHRQWRCMICPDHTGEFADVSVGDPWYRPIESGDPGKSLVLVRSDAGRAAVRRAIADGELILTRVGSDTLPRSQPNLLVTRGAVWGRTTVMSAMGLPVPQFRRVPTFPVWWAVLSPRQKASSLLGTIRRIIRRKLHRRTPVHPLEECAEPEPEPERFE